jgi:hypothetical protein
MGPIVVPLLEAGSAPFHPSVPVPPLAVQPAALVVLQLKVVD